MRSRSRRSAISGNQNAVSTESRPDRQWFVLAFYRLRLSITRRLMHRFGDVALRLQVHTRCPFERQGPSLTWARLLIARMEELQAAM